MTTRYSKFIRLINLLGDLIWLNLAFLIAFQIKLGYEYGWDIPRPYLILLLYLNILWLLISFVLENYELSRLDRYRDASRKILQSVLLHLFLLASVLVFLKTTYFSRVQLLLNYACLASGLVFWRVLVIFLLRNYRRMGYNYRAFIIVGYGDMGLNLLDYFGIHPEFGYRFQGFFDDQTKGKDILGKVSDLKNYLNTHQVDEVYLSLPDFDKNHLKAIVQLADHHLARIKVIPDFQAFAHRPLKIESYGSIPVILHRKEPLEDVMNRAIKRLFDVVFSFLVLVGILTWAIPLIALLIKLSSSGPVFFYQKRSGKRGEEFNCLKFRTMYINDDCDQKQASRDDRRVTPLGKVLRRTNLDELPQFFNVLWGDMSVVGPRPHMLKHTEYYAELVDKYMVRHFVKPGITGLAQIKGYRGETKDIQAMIHRIRMDIFYVENWSFLLDVKIIWMTVIRMLSGDENAF